MLCLWMGNGKKGKPQKVKYTCNEKIDPIFFVLTLSEMDLVQ